MFFNLRLVLKSASISNWIAYITIAIMSWVTLNAAESALLQEVVLFGLDSLCIFPLNELSLFTLKTAETG